MVETDHSGEPLRAPGLAGVAQARLAHGVWRAQTEQRSGWGGTGFERDEQGGFRRLFALRSRDIPLNFTE